MAGTEAGGKKAAATILAKNPNFYREIGERRRWIEVRSNKTGFALNRGGSSDLRPNQLPFAG